MLRPIDQYFLRHKEPIKSCLEYLRDLILQSDSGIVETWSYGMPFYSLNGKRCFYVWVDLKSSHPYIGFVDGKLINDPALIAGSGKRMKIFMIDPKKNIPVARINKLLSTTIQVYK